MASFVRALAQSNHPGASADAFAVSLNPAYWGFLSGPKREVHCPA